MRSSDRPGVLVMVQGTRPEVAVTDVTIDLLDSLRAAGVAAAVRLPVEFHDPDSDGPAERLARACGEPIEAICSWSFSAEAAAPLLAAKRLGQNPPSIGRLFADTHFHPATNLALVQTSGSLAAPVGTDGDNVDLITGFDPDAIVLVAPAGRAVDDVAAAARLLDEWNLLVLLIGYDGSEDHMEQFAWVQTHHTTFIDAQSVTGTLVTMAERESRFAS